MGRPKGSKNKPVEEPTVDTEQTIEEGQEFKPDPKKRYHKRGNMIFECWMENGKPRARAYKRKGR